MGSQRRTLRIRRIYSRTIDRARRQRSYLYVNTLALEIPESAGDEMEPHEAALALDGHTSTQQETTNSDRAQLLTGQHSLLGA